MALDWQNTQNSALGESGVESHLGQSADRVIDRMLYCVIIIRTDPYSQLQWDADFGEFFVTKALLRQRGIDVLVAVLHIAFNKKEHPPGFFTDRKRIAPSGTTWPGAFRKYETAVQDVDSPTAPGPRTVALETYQGLHRGVPTSGSITVPRIVVYTNPEDLSEGQLEPGRSAFVEWLKAPDRHPPPGTSYDVKTIGRRWVRQLLMPMNALLLPAPP